IKPDVMALGNGNFVASPGAGNTGYTSGSGTSFSCPMTAGACAVILSANPSLTPMQVLQLLKQTADSTLTPNRLRGWGLINCWEAVKLAKPKTLNLTMLIEGFYDSIANTLTGDTVNVYIRNNSSPFAIVDSARAKLNSAGIAALKFSNVTNGINYYLEITHRNGLETWSKTPQSFTSNVMTYDFSTDSAKAFGNNLKHSGSRWVIYEGDVNQNGVVELSDIILISNNATLFVTGYNITDVNGNNVTDLNDIILALNNSSNFVSVKKP
ncbi:MAG: S8 family serine peptidase, partial [Ignavibacteria bacterium]